MKHVLCARHSPKHRACMILFNPHTHLVLTPPALRGRTVNTEVSAPCPGRSQLVSDRAAPLREEGPP